ncbi:29371_t:CDS:1, partial [Racocetra persica]
ASDKKDLEAKKNILLGIKDSLALNNSKEESESLIQYEKEAI